MPYFLKQILDIIFPPTKNAKMIRSSQNKLVPIIQTHITSTKVRVTTLLSYKNKLSRAYIQELKYYKNKKSAHALASILHDFLIEEMANKEFLNNKKYILIPLPLSKKRQKERGFNQIEEIFSELIAIDSYYNKIIDTHILIRTLHSKPQTHLNRTQRLNNVKNVFSLHKKSQLNENIHYIIVDDVVTTGATLKSAKKPLLNAVRAENITLLALMRA